MLLVRISLLLVISMYAVVLALGVLLSFVSSMIAILMIIFSKMINRGIGYGKKNYF